MSTSDQGSDEPLALRLVEPRRLSAGTGVHQTGLGTTRCPAA